VDVLPFNSLRMGVLRFPDGQPAFHVATGEVAPITTIREEPSTHARVLFLTRAAGQVITETVKISPPLFVPVKAVNV
jgi:hypothetical protein